MPGIDALSRQRYLAHLVDAEGVSRVEAQGFLDVLSASLAAGDAEASAMLAEMESRMALVQGFSAAVEATARAESDGAKAERLREALERVAGAGRTASPRAIQGYAARRLAELG